MTETILQVAKRADQFFMETSPIHETMRRVSKTLNDMQISFAIAGAMAGLFLTQRGFLFNIAFLLGEMTSRLFGNTPEFKFATWEIWVALACFALVSLWMISRKLRAYEVVS